ncbi:MAG TPA: DNA mismatch repair endonuclease MutL [Candidatus Binataceae bacterium]|nr:DNA mismatch repair endonuclease MutL [Candidatus Binataceae bacterium]
MPDRIIHILPEQVASQIAAGEVVERPASAVKELVENSLDAGARSIAVEIERGGCALLAVSDDGSGMGREDAVVSIRRHATSKIRGAGDLAAIRTLGFRGEALASIASVSRMTLRSRRAGDDHGIELAITGGDIDATRECALAHGTRIEVRELFFNTPARLKFLKTVATEQSVIAEAMQRLALANHQIAFRLTSDGRVIFDLPRATTILERARQLFGPKLAPRMLAFDLRRVGLRAWGLAATSQESFATARMIFTFVNGRTVRDRLLVRAVEQAYQTLIPRGRHPAVILFVEIHPEEVDVNVHPMKTEVRFRNSGAIFEAVYHALRDRLANQTEDPSAPQEVAMQSSHGAAAALEAAQIAPPVPNHNVASMAAAVPARSEAPLRLVPDAPLANPAVQRALGLAFSREAANGVEHQGRPIPMYSQLRVIGQLFAGYIALEGEDGLLLVDQHAAHERVTFEKLKAELKSGGIRVQAMLTPQSIELNPARAAQIQAAIPELRAMGFDVEAFGPSTLLLNGAPAVFGVEQAGRLLSDMLDAVGEMRIRGESGGAFEEMLKRLACHGSVRVGRVLEDREIRALLEELDRTEFKTNCPHGRPVHIGFPRGQIERMFRR